MSQAWIEYKMRQDADFRAALTVPFVWLLLTACFAYSFFSSATPTFLSAFSERMHYSVGLDQCSTAFSRLAITHIALIFAFSIPFLAVAALAAKDGFAGTGNASQLIKIAMVSVAVAVLLVLHSIGEGAAWQNLPTRAHRYGFAEACQLSHQTPLWLRQLLGFWTYALIFGYPALVLAVFKWRRARLGNPTAPQLDSDLKAKVAAAKAKFGVGEDLGVPERQFSRSENAWIMNILGLMVIGLIVFAMQGAVRLNAIMG